MTDDDDDDDGNGEESNCMNDNIDIVINDTDNN